MPPGARLPLRWGREDGKTALSGPYDRPGVRCDRPGSLRTNPPNPPNPGQNDPVPGQTSLQGPENPAVEAVRTPSPYLYPSGKPAEGLVRRRGSRCVFPLRPCRDTSVQMSVAGRPPSAAVRARGINGSIRPPGLCSRRPRRPPSRPSRHAGARTGPCADRPPRLCSGPHAPAPLR